jgi:hypothetical protein
MTIQTGGRQILIHGLALILAGLLWGFAPPMTPFPRLALGAHPVRDERTTVHSCWHPSARGTQSRWTEGFVGGGGLGVADVADGAVRGC